MSNVPTHTRPLNTAVLFLVFNRPSATSQVFEAIRKAKPPKLYIAADGARADRKGEIELTQKVREIATAVDWQCEVKTLFRDQNLGCKRAVCEAIYWFFEHEDKGIILEDDTLPNQDFFYFVENNLEKYKLDNRVMMITGTNFLSNPNYKDPYFFSEHMSIWGWGTWKRAWDLYDVNMNSWKTSEAKEFFNKKYFASYISKYYKYIFNSLQLDKIDTWDYQWVFTCLYNHGLCVTPSVNLISNIGTIGAHTNGVTDSHFMKVYTLKFDHYSNYYPIVHVNYKHDFTQHKIYSRKIARMMIIIELLKKIYLYNLLRFIKKLIIGLRKNLYHKKEIQKLD
ncbi:MAG: hypothetical protein DCC88_02575 [Spirobacillus cienkowskii]|jgi:hypothetical protein|uniref:Nucleotide-diphospho-sugar transferase n=1 Tax=Spirobacillus cienkowskii TaxID=495820 RepID=A0A369KW36_9BACT|nr:MAG: hypothetical protein DCC88_02575 [Spirobacillus cienkowskii]